VRHPCWCRCIRPWVCCPECAQAWEQGYGTRPCKVQDTKIFEGPTCRSRGPRSSQRSQIPPRENPPLLGNRLGKGRATLGRRQRRHPGKACWDSRRQGTPHQPLLHDPRHGSVRCQAAKRLSGSHSPHGSPFLPRKPTDDTRPMTCQTSRRGAGKIAWQALLGNQRHDIKRHIKCALSACRVRYDSTISCLISV